MEGQGIGLYYVQLEWKDKEENYIMLSLSGRTRKRTILCFLEWKDKEENYIMLSLSERTRKRTTLC